MFLTLQLDNPSYYLKFDDVKKMYIRDMEISLGVSDKHLAVKLVEDPEFMLSYSLVSLAKNHNFFA